MARIDIGKGTVNGEPLNIGEGSISYDDTNPKDKFGEKKPPLHLIPPAAMIEESIVMALGAYKYGPYNWRQKKVRTTVYISALMRHAMAYLDGEDKDQQSKVSHLAHIRACCGILLDARETGNLIDDRPQNGAVGAVYMDEATMDLRLMYEGLEKAGVPRFEGGE